MLDKEKLKEKAEEMWTILHEQGICFIGIPLNRRFEKLERDILGDEEYERLYGENDV